MDLCQRATSCRVCGTPAIPPFALCFCCATLVHQLGMPLAPLVVVAEFHPGDALHRRLRGYKDAPVAERRADCTARLAAMLRAWLATGPARLRPAVTTQWDLVVTVPSTCRPAGDPVAAVVDAVPVLAERRRSLLVRGPAPTGHLRAARRGFALRSGPDRRWRQGRRVLVVDDAVVTGARAQSAAAALRLGGAEVVGVVALGRLAPTRSGSRS